MQSINSLLTEFCDRIEWAAMTYRKTDIQFDTLEELLSYDNYSSNRIVQLEITGYQNWKRFARIEIQSDEMGLINYGSTLSCSYTVDSIDSELNFINQLEIILKKATASYWLLGKFSLFGTISAPSMLSTICGIITGGYARPKDISFTIALIIIASALVIILVSRWIDKHFLRNLFPPIQFLWGEEVSRNSKWEKLRSNIFWGIIIALLIGIVAGYIASLFF